MTLCKLRYYFEHKFLRKYYFENTVPFLAEMFEDSIEQIEDKIISLFHKESN